MPHSNWKGTISFGLVNIPILLFNAVDPKSTVAFKQINRKTGARIKYQRIDAETGQEVPWEQIGKGFEYEKDIILPVKEDELKRVVGENARTIAIDEFIDKKHIHLLNVERTYYIVPDKKGEQGYVILREALEKTNKVGIAKVIISTKDYLAALATYDNALVLHLLHYDDEIRKLSELPIPDKDIKKYKVTSKEIDIATKVINAMSGKWKPSQYKDEYKAAVEKWVQAKARHLPETHMPSRRKQGKAGANVVSFVDLLKKSLASSKPSKANKKKPAKHAPIPHAKHNGHKRATRH